MAQLCRAVILYNIIIYSLYTSNIFPFLYHFSCISSVDSPYRTPINRAILTLGEKGVLLALKKKWWQDIGGGLCIEDEAEKSASTSELGLASVGGVFFVLMCGLCGSFFIAICEFLWNIRKVAVTEKVNFHFVMFTLVYY